MFVLKPNALRAVEHARACAHAGHNHPRHQTRLLNSAVSLVDSQRFVLFVWFVVPRQLLKLPLTVDQGAKYRPGIARVCAQKVVFGQETHTASSPTKTSVYPGRLRTEEILSEIKGIRDTRISAFLLRCHPSVSVAHFLIKAQSLFGRIEWRQEALFIWSIKFIFYLDFAGCQGHLRLEAPFDQSVKNQWQVSFRERRDRVTEDTVTVHYSQHVEIFEPCEVLQD